MYNYSPYGMSMKTPEQLNQEYAQLMQQYQNMYRAVNMQGPPQMQMQNLSNQSAVSTSGDYKIVEKYADVENTPTRLDGTASLFFDFTNMVFWSKKFINGQHAIQAYKFMPINTTGDNPENKSEPVKQESTAADNSLLESILDRLTALEESLQNKSTKDEIISNKQITKKSIIDEGGQLNESK